MFSTIAISPYIQVQGLVTETLSGGRVAITVGDRQYVGRPVSAHCAIVKARPAAHQGDQG